MKELLFWIFENKIAQVSKKYFYLKLISKDFLLIYILI